MAKCSECGTNRELNVTMTDANGSKVFCRCCLAIREQNANEPTFVNSSELIDDITGQPGAVKYEAINESYTLDAAAMRRLIFLNLRPDEWHALVKKYDEYQFMLHEDFYDEEGNAMQPYEE